MIPVQEISNLADKAIEFCKEVFRIPRSIVSKGNLDSLRILESYLNPSLKYIDIASGTEANGWVVPNEWNLVSASVITPKGEELINLEASNLYVVIGSIPVRQTLSLEQLLPYIYSRPDLPDAIPYITSYYAENWGICLPHKVVKELSPGDYKVCIEVSKPPGVMRLGEVRIPGREKKEIFLSTYFCHPAMANNELSGPALWMSLANYLWRKSLEGNLRYTFRLYIGPETIGAIHYLSLRSTEIIEKTIAGYVLTCVGVDSDLVYMPSRSGDTLADRAARKVISKYDYQDSSFALRGSDERQWCSPAVNLPICSVMTKKYHEYPEYHTSLDNLDFISVKGLERTLAFYIEVFDVLENNDYFINSNLGEPKLDKIGLFPQINTGGNNSHLIVRNTLNILNLLDGTVDSLQIAETLKLDFQEVNGIIQHLYSSQIISKCL